MNKITAIIRQLPVYVAISFLLGACATGPKIDWGSRVGTYTYDQAVMEFGPPDKDARLQDGSIVAEWLTQAAYTRATPSGAYGYGYPYYYYGPFYPTYTETYSPNYFLRLVFGPDGKLQTWKQFTK